MIRFIVLLLTACSALLSSAAAPPREIPAKTRIDAIAAALPAQPVGLGVPATDRAQWTKVSGSLPVRELLSAARAVAAEPPPELTDELYRRFSRDGNRDAFQNVNNDRLHRLNLLAWAEAVEHKGRFMPALIRQLESILGEKTWTLPAHDRKLNNFEGRTVEVDLMAAMKGWAIATVAYWHADQLPAPLLATLRGELRRRVIGPFLAAARNGRGSDGMWWLHTDNNWNAVCHAGVVGTALATLESRAERAEVIAHAELDSQDYLQGFTADGYCSEGVGYWNYGFGHYTMMADTLARETGGAVRLLAGDHALRIAAYPWALQILPDVYPAYADMDIADRPSTWFGALAVLELYPKPLGMKSWNLSVSDLRNAMLYEAAMKVFLPYETAGLPAAPAPKVSGNHYWFADAQVYTGRAAATFGASIKGGHNAEHHNHNDVGSYVVACGDRAVLVDPGKEVYTARTFGPRRYDSKVLSSYGHPVPVVAGQLQRPGREFAARVVSTSFSDAADTIVLDLTRAYAVPALKSLVRTFTLRRQPKPEIVISDTVTFTEPSAFETAVITFEPWRETAPGGLHIGGEGTAVNVKVTSDIPWTLHPEILHEDLPRHRFPTRLGITCTPPVTTATLTLTVTPE